MDTKEFRAAFLVIGAFLACLVLVWAVSVGCIENSLVVEPSPVDVDISSALPPAVDGNVATNDDDPVSLVFKPPAITGPSGTSVVVQVIALNQAGQEIPSVNLTVTVGDTAIATVKDIEGRFISFSLVAAGTTSVIVTAAGAQATFEVTVT